MSKILLCPDSFKGSISAPAAAAALAEGIRAARPDMIPVCLPVADGGEGTLDALCPPESRIAVTVQDPFSRPVTAHIGILEGNIAVVEMAQAAGLTLLAPEERDPLRASTFGVGEMIRAALDRGCRRLLITVGGSATNDGGCGMMAALGLGLLDEKGETVIPVGGNLGKICRVDASGLDPRLAACEITLATDVTNPLCGPQGATHIYGRQKGATEEALALLESGMQSFAAVVDVAAGRPVSTLPGCGAGGGLGFGLLAFAGAKLCSGIDAVLDALDFEEKLTDTVAVITGEGRTDGQSACGKAVAGVARRAAACDVPVYVLSGSIQCDENAMNALEAAGVRGIWSILEGPATLAQAMADPAPRLTRAAGRLARMLAPDPVGAGLAYAAACLREGEAVAVILHPGSSPTPLQGSGIAPIVHALRADPDAMKNGIVADKIVGLAAAYLFLHGRVKAVHGEVMSEAAHRFLTDRNIPHTATTVVEKIINRKGDGICPMEARALTLSDPAEAFALFDSIVK